jgi:non-ribosomal peptide synthetase component E (peptide arylation enzyme)
MTLHAEAIERKQKAPPLTVDGLLRRRASQRPGVTALCDPPNLAALGFGEPKTLSYRETDAAVDALASFFIEAGLEPGDTVVAQLPNLAMAPLTLLGAWRAGLTVAAVPMLWRAEEIAKVCAEVAPKALIGVSSFVGEKRAETLCAVAASQLSVRFVLGFGQDLPDGVASLDEVVAAGQTGRERLMDSPPRLSPAMITFTARAGAPLVAIARREDELLAQGAMTVLSLSLDAGDVILNPYPLTGPVGLSLGLMAWLVGGGALVQHTPFDYQPFVRQLLDSGATVTAMPPSILAELVKDGVLRQPSCRLRRLGAVWSMPELAASAPPPFYGATPLLFDVYPLGDLASLVLRRETRSGLTSLPIGHVDFEDDETTVFIETKLGRVRAGEADELLLRGPLVPRSKGPLQGDAEGFVSTGLRAEAEPGASGRLRIKRDAELLHHGGFAVAASELDQLYQSFPGYLDAACFVLSDPIIGERIFAAIVPKASEPIALEALHSFLVERQVAPYKFPDRLLVVKQIPRDADGRVLREQILQQV